MLYILHGDDELSRSEQLLQWKSTLGDATVSGLNSTILDGRGLSLVELRAACDALPFIGDRRMVVVEGFLTRFELSDRSQRRGQAKALSDADTLLVQQLCDYLPRLPASTRLVFLEKRSLHRSNGALRALMGLQGVHVRELRAPEERSLPQWISSRMSLKGGQIEAGAARLLADLVGADTRQLDLELDKLVNYVNARRAVTPEDVNWLVSARQMVDIFDLVDAVGLRQAGRAMSHLHDLLDNGASPMHLIRMLERQLRMLTQTKELTGQGASSAEMMRHLGVKHAFLVDKLSRQAQNFSRGSLIRALSQLACTENAIKTGEIAEPLALDLLVSELCLPQARVPVSD